MYKLIGICGITIAAMIALSSVSYAPRPIPEQPEPPIDYANIIGQSLIVGIDSTELTPKEKAIFEKIKPGGVVLYSRNIESISQLKKLITDMQAISLKSSGLPLFIFMDEEPEGAYRLGIYKGVFNSGYPNWDRIEQQTKIAKDIGINVILSPVLDYPLTKNTFIKKRIPPIASIEDFTDFNDGFIQTLSRNGMLSTIKHFPGAGLLLRDPHDSTPQFSGRSLLETSLDIFQKGIDSGAQFVMTTHAVYSDIDPDNVATVSMRIVSDLLIQKMHFDGVVITDDISDMALANEKTDLTQAGMSALKAGNHMIMYSHYLEETEVTFDAIASGINTDALLRDRVKENFDKIKATKERYIPLQN